MPAPLKNHVHRSIHFMAILFGLIIVVLTISRANYLTQDVSIKVDQASMEEQAESISDKIEENVVEQIVVTVDRPIEVIDEAPVEAVELVVIPVVEPDSSPRLPPALCTAGFIVTDIGRPLYPIDPKYDGLGLLGEFFTAADCGPSRLAMIWGVDGNFYIIGAKIWLKKNPTHNLVAAFLGTGFRCEDGDSDVSCNTWSLSDTVSVDDLLKIQAYYEFFDTADCVNCG